jgi:carboxypeptidase D
MDELNERSDNCGYTDFINEAMQFPPAGPLPSPPKHHSRECEIWKDVIPAAQSVNPCWDVYAILTTCKNWA